MNDLIDKAVAGLMETPNRETRLPPSDTISPTDLTPEKVDHLSEEALDEMLIKGGQLNTRLLGGYTD